MSNLMVGKRVLSSLLDLLNKVPIEDPGKEVQAQSGKSPCLMPTRGNGFDKTGRHEGAVTNVE